MERESSCNVLELGTANKMPINMLMEGRNPMGDLLIIGVRYHILGKCLHSRNLTIEKKTLKAPHTCIKESMFYSTNIKKHI